MCGHTWFLGGRHIRFDSRDKRFEGFELGKSSETTDILGEKFH